MLQDQQPVLLQQLGGLSVLAPAQTVDPGADKLCSAQCGAAEVGAGEVGCEEGSAFEIGTAQIGAAE